MQYVIHHGAPECQVFSQCQMSMSKVRSPFTSASIACGASLLCRALLLRQYVRVRCLFAEFSYMDAVISHSGALAPSMQTHR